MGDTVFHTPWFDVKSEIVTSPLYKGEPFYSICAPDGVLIIATTREGNVVVEKQFRPAVQKDMIEFPSGVIDDGETPEIAARRELLEETGYEAEQFEKLGVLAVSPDRLTMHVHVYYAGNAKKKENIVLEDGVEPYCVDIKELYSMISCGEFSQFSGIAALALLAIRKKPAIFDNLIV